MSTTTTTTHSSSPETLWQDGLSETGDSRAQRGRPDWTDLVFFLLLSAGAGYALMRHGGAMDYYEKIILCGTVPALAWLGWLWRPLRGLMVACAIAAGVALMLYGNDLARAEQVFFLKYLFSSQSAILWMSALFALAMVCYWIGFFSPTAAWLGTALTWGAVFAGTTGMLVRWREGHLMGPDLGHIPVSNLYEVFVLFALITALFYLYYERKYATRALGGFVLLVVTSAVVFLLWYSFTRDAGQIQPLVPALKSWWMKLHVPANFIGYGTFSLAAMVGFAYLVKQHGQTSSWLAGAAVRAGRAAVRRTHGVPLGRPVGHLDAVFRHRRGDRRRHPAGPAPHRRRAAVAGGAGRHHVSRHRHRLRLLHGRHHPGRAVGGRRLGRLLAVGSRKPGR